ncbi:hypothetical protein BD779DRAFT_1485880 [Infundibulicybe gibba]|nr:hypothetical protein BD779DRAFT_1485880 [Infundibulicybe gibba]
MMVLSVIMYLNVLRPRARTIILSDYFLATSNRGIASSATSTERRQATANKLKKQITQIHLTKGRSVSDPKADIFNSTIIRIRQALKDRNVSAVMEYWEYLDQNKLLRFLGSSQLEMISGLVATSFLPTKNAQNPWEPSSQRLVEDIALRAAAGRATDALNACMLMHIKRGDPAAAVELYKRFTTIAGKHGMPTDPDLVNEDSELEIGSLATELASIGSTPPLLGRITLLLAVITAHAMQDEFQEALTTCLSSNMRLHRHIANDYLKRLKYDPRLQQKVEKFIRRLNVACMVARSPSLTKQVKNLSTTNASGLIKLYESVIEGLSGPDAYIAADSSGLTPQKSVALTELSWTAFLVAFLKCQRRDVAAKIWDDMGQFGARPGVFMWTALIDAYNDIRAVDEALAGWSIMHSQGIQPNALTYRALISTLFNGHRPDEAIGVFHEFQTKALKECPLEDNLSVHNTVLHGLLAIGRFDGADDLLRIMKQSGPTPDIVSYNTFLAYHGRRGNFTELASLVNTMTAAGLTGDVFSFSTILSALLKAGREDAPEMILKMMRKQGVEPNVATFSAIIDQQMREQNVKNLRAAVRMLRQMEQDSAVQPNEVTYTSILAGLYRGDWLPQGEAEEWRRDIVERMKTRSVQFNIPTYHILLKACLEYPPPEGLQNALGYYREMVQRKIPLTHTTWGEWAIANEIVNEMYLSGVQPNGGVLELAVQAKEGCAQSKS